MAGSPSVELEVGGRVVRVSNPDRMYFPAGGVTKLDVAHYYLAVGPGIVNALRERPCMLHRFPTGVTGEKVHQKRVPAGAPPWIETVRVRFPRYGLHADELCVTELAQVIWAEVDDAEPADLTIATVPGRFAELGDLHAGIDAAPFPIDELLAWADRDERDGAVDPAGPERR
jgi:DNA primase